MYLTYRNKQPIDKIRETEEYDARNKTKSYKILKKLNKVEISNLLVRNSRYSSQRCSLNVEKNMHEHSDIFNKEIENIKKSKQS